MHALIALSLILSQNKISDANPEVEITIELLKDDTDNGFKLGADIKVTLENMSQQDAEICGASTSILSILKSDVVTLTFS